MSSSQQINATSAQVQATNEGASIPVAATILVISAPVLPLGLSSVPTASVISPFVTPVPSAGPRVTFPPSMTQFMNDPANLQAIQGFGQVMAMCQQNGGMPFLSGMFPFALPGAGTMPLQAPMAVTSFQTPMSQPSPFQPQLVSTMAPVNLAGALNAVGPSRPPQATDPQITPDGHCVSIESDDGEVREAEPARTRRSRSNRQEPARTGASHQEGEAESQPRLPVANRLTIPNDRVQQMEAKLERLEKKVGEKNDRDKPLARSPFTTRVHLTPFPRKVKIDAPRFTGKEDPEIHLDSFNQSATITVAPMKKSAYFSSKPCGTEPLNGSISFAREALTRSVIWPQNSRPSSRRIVLRGRSSPILVQPGRGSLRTSLSSLPGGRKRGVNVISQEITKRETREKLEPEAETVEIELHPSDSSRMVRIGANLPEDLKEQITRVLQEYAGIFAWSVADMPGIDRSVICHRLAVREGGRPVRQKKRYLASDRRDFVKREVKDLLSVGHIREVNKPTEQWWEMAVDGASGPWGYVGGIVFTTTEGFKIYHAIVFNFKLTNNEAEYEALAGGLRLAQALKISRVSIKSDFNLIVGQVTGNMEAREGRMAQYKDLVHAPLRGFEEFKIAQIPRAENADADLLSKLSQYAPEHVSKLARVEILDRANIKKLEVAAITAGSQFDRSNLVGADDHWMYDLMEYLVDGSLPEQDDRARKVKLRAPRFQILDGKLYKRAFGGPLLICLTNREAERVIAEVHEGVCAAHQMSPGAVRLIGD
ncbi:unnamed protein product [Cuscuta campestris]|uniref:RNase H type-1 domain-containing protein n=1 Tax=Cuscuta campestris TaxID=132261 RepID=A0A484L2G6_9ASTE|nr:unnamed protein product [Cuscuta campestris]